MVESYFKLLFIRVLIEFLHQRNQFSLLSKILTMKAEGHELSVFEKFFQGFESSGMRDIEKLF